MRGTKIKSIKAREILDSRGEPTVEVDLATDPGLFRDSVPSGASTGKYEAKELRDGGKRYGGRGVLKAVQNINQIIAPKLKGKEAGLQKEPDDLMRELDATQDKSKLGANAILAVSMAVCRAGAAANNLPLYQYIAKLAETGSPPILPLGCFNIINGGAHAGNGLDFQEFMITPQFRRFSKNLEAGAKIYHELKKILIGKNLGADVGDEGGFAPPIRRPEEALELILLAVKKAGYQDKIKFMLDIAASQFFADNRYKTKMGIFTQQGLLNYYSNLASKYPIWALEDPFFEEDWEGFRKIIKLMKGKIKIVGDDLLATNPERIKIAKEKMACNAMILKLNQIGTVSEGIEAAKLAKSYGWKIIVSHRSGETCDDFIADFAVGIGADYIKAGAPAKGERVAKYNRLLEIEEEIK